MRGHARQHNSRHGLRVRMLFCVAFILIFLLLTSGFIITFSRVTVRDQIDSVYKVLNDGFDTKASRCAQSLYDLAVNIAYSNSTQGALYASHPLTRMQSLQSARQLFLGFEYMDPDIIDILVYEPEGRRVHSSSGYTALEMSEAEKLTVGGGRGTTRGQVSPVLRLGNSTLSFLYVLPYRSALSRSAAAGSPVSRACILYKLEGMLDLDLLSAFSENHICIQDAETAFSLTEMPEDVLTVMTEGTGRIEEMQIHGIPYIVYRFSVPGTTWRLSCSIPRRDIVTPANQDYRNTGLFVFWIGALAVIAIIQYELIYTHHSIHSLIQSVASVGDDDSAHFSATGLPEMRMLSDELNHLMNRINHANALNVQAQQNVYQAMLEKEHAEMAFYRTQINPHFLFNTLEFIRSMAHECSARPVERMIVLTSRNLQYSLYSKYIVPLRDELDNARNYMELMNSRTMGKCVFREEICDDALNHPMVSMVLQPILENAILHGARKQGEKPLCIDLIISLTQADELQIIVRDDGRGMAPDVLDALNGCVDGMSSLAATENIGIQNIARRIKLADPLCRMRFASEEGRFTQVLLTIPAKLSLEGDISVMSNSLNPQR